jgi:hypothetical protein
LAGISPATQDLAKAYFGTENKALDVYQKAEVSQLRQLLQWQNTFTVIACYDPKDADFVRILEQDSGANICSIKKREFFFYSFFLVLINYKKI